MRQQVVAFCRSQAHITVTLILPLQRYYADAVDVDRRADESRDEAIWRTEDSMTRVYATAQDYGGAPNDAPYDIQKIDAYDARCRCCRTRYASRMRTIRRRLAARTTLAVALAVDTLGQWRCLPSRLPTPRLCRYARSLRYERRIVRGGNGVVTGAAFLRASRACVRDNRRELLRGDIIYDGGDTGISRGRDDATILAIQRRG